MDPRNIDIANPAELSQICSRQYEDYLDWLENQNRPSLNLFTPFRLFASLTTAFALIAGFGSLIR